MNKVVLSVAALLLFSVFTLKAQTADLIFASGFEELESPSVPIYVTVEGNTENTPLDVPLGSTQRDLFPFKVVNEHDQYIFIYSFDLTIQPLESGAPMPFENIQLFLQGSGPGAITTSCGSNCFRLSFDGGVLAAARTYAPFVLRGGTATSSQFPGAVGKTFRFQITSASIRLSAGGSNETVGGIPSTPFYIRTP